MWSRVEVNVESGRIINAELGGIINAQSGTIIEKGERERERTVEGEFGTRDFKCAEKVE